MARGCGIFGKIEFPKKRPQPLVFSRSRIESRLGFLRIELRNEFCYTIPHRPGWLSDAHAPGRRLDGVGKHLKSNGFGRSRKCSILRRRRGRMCLAFNTIALHFILHCLGITPRSKTCPSNGKRRLPHVEVVERLRTQKSHSSNQKRRFNNYCNPRRKANSFGMSVCAVSHMISGLMPA